MLRAAGRRPGTGCSTRRGTGTSRRASRGACRSPGPVGSRRGCGGSTRVEPVRAPLPHVAGDVVQPEAVRRERVDGRGAVPTVGARVSARERRPARRSCGARRRARARRPRGTAAAEPPRAACSHSASVGSRVPRPRAVRLRVVPRDVHDGVVRPRPSRSDCGPSGCAPVGAEHLAPPRRRRDAARCPGSRRAAARRTRTTSRTLGARSRGRSRRRTRRSASFVTVTASIRNGRERRPRGPGPRRRPDSRGIVAPMRNRPAGTCTGRTRPAGVLSAETRVVVAVAPLRSPTGWQHDVMTRAGGPSAPRTPPR